MVKDMKTQKRNIADWPLLASYLSDNIEKTEREKAIDWKEKSDENRLEFQKAEKIWVASQQTSEYNIDVESAWEKVNGRASVQPVAKSRLMLQITRKYILRVAAVIVFGFISWYTAKYFLNENTFRSGTKQVQLSLNDGSHVALNREAQLNYPGKFKGNIREVYLKGEAYFEVAKNPKKPFIIHASKACIMVIGTSFNVVVKNNGNVELVVNSGVVAFGKDGLKQKAILHVNEKAVLDATSGNILKYKNTDQNYLSWKTKKFVFRETKLREVFSLLQEVYGINIDVKDARLNDLKLTATYDKLEPNEIIKMIKMTFKLQTVVTGNNFIIEAGNSI
jgi:ferric-dicitrate binding protein FerR (iron transport regulator)